MLEPFITATLEPQVGWDVPLDLVPVHDALLVLALGELGQVWVSPGGPHTVKNLR